MGAETSRSSRGLRSSDRLPHRALRIAQRLEVGDLPRVHPDLRAIGPGERHQLSGFELLANDLGHLLHLETLSAGEHDPRLHLMLLPRTPSACPACSPPAGRAARLQAARE